MGWLTDYLEKLSLIDYAAKKMNPPQTPSSFLWKPFSRKSREAYFAQQKARAKEAEERFTREKARREKMYAEQEKPCPALAARGFKREGDGFCASFILFAA